MRRIRFDRRLYQTFVAVGDGPFHQLRRFAVAVQHAAGYAFGHAFSIDGDVNFQQSFALTSAYGKQAVGAAAFQRRREVEIVWKFDASSSLPLPLWL